VLDANGDQRRLSAQPLTPTLSPSPGRGEERHFAFAPRAGALQNTSLKSACMPLSEP